MSRPAIPGYDIAHVERWIAGQRPDIELPLQWQVLASGHSNLTCVLTDATGARFVIRRPPLGKLLPKAHDMYREWRLISALHGSRIPVPRPIAFCDETSVTGADFYLMEHIEGRSLRSADDVRNYLAPESRAVCANGLIDALASLHDIEPGAVGLADLGRPNDYLARQIGTWYKSWVASSESSRFDHPTMHRMREQMLASLPEQAPARIVHGDYGLHNCLVTANGDLAAIVDWEISTLGDPLADLSYALLFFADPDEATPQPSSIGAVEGFPTRSALAARYGQQSGRDLAHLDFYFAFNLWKSAAIVQGVYARYLAGAKSSAGVDLDVFSAAIDRTIQGAVRLFERWKQH